MKKFKIYLIASLLLVAIMSELRGQQVPQFSQYMFNPLFINPAYTGYKEQLYVQSYYRRQWAGVEGSPETFAIAADGFLPKSNLGIGVVGLSDKIGAQRTNAFYGSLSYHLRVAEEHYLSFGTSVGIVNSVLDGGSLTIQNPNDPSIPGNRQNAFYPDVKLGLFYYNPVFFFGTGFDNVISPVLNLDNGDLIIEPRVHMNVSGGLWIDLGSSVALRPSFLYLDDFKASPRLDINTSLVVVDKFWIGASYRTGVNIPSRVIPENLQRGTAIVGLVEFYIMDNLRLGYAYDHNINGFDIRALTTHDISIGYTLPQKRARAFSSRYF